MSVDFSTSQSTEGRECWHSTYPNTLACASHAVTKVRDCVRRGGISDDHADEIATTVMEAAANTVCHGNPLIVAGVRQTDASGRGVGDPTKTFRVAALCVNMKEQVVLIVELGNEFHAPFDPTTVPDPTDDKNLNCPGGRGVLWMQLFSSYVAWNRGEDGRYIGNRVQLIFHYDHEHGLQKLGEEHVHKLLNAFVGGVRWLLDSLGTSHEAEAQQPTTAGDAPISPALS